MARMAGQPVDKVPNLNIAMALVAKCAGVSYREYAQNYKKLVEGNLYCVEHFGFDAVSAISDPMRETASQVMVKLIYGVFDLTSIVYFLSVIAVFLFLTVQSLEKRRWSE